MANEITLSVSFSAVKSLGVLGSAVASSLTASVTMTGSHMSSQTVKALLSNEVAVPVGSVPVGGLVILKNIGANIVYVGAAGLTSGTAFLIIGAGEVAIFRRSAVPLFMVTGANTLLQVTTVED